MRVLLTGAAGFIGSHLYDSLLAYRHDVLPVDMVPPMHTTSASVFETRDYIHHLNEVACGDFDAVVHQAAITDTTVPASAQLSDVNTRGVAELGRACAASGTRLIFASSSSVYGALKVPGLSCEVGDERDQTLCSGPLNAYAQSKYDAENELQGIASLNFVAFRYTNVFGAREEKKGHMASILTQLLRQAAQSGTVRIFKDTLTACRDFVPVEVVTRAVVDALQGKGAKQTGIFNLGSGRSISFAEVLEWLAGFSAENNLVATLVPNPHAGAYQYRTAVQMQKTFHSFDIPDLTAGAIYARASELYAKLENGVCRP